MTACDIRYCTEDAFFSVKEVDLAITADLGTFQRLPGIVEYGNTVELVFTGRRFSTLEAKSMGWRIQIWHVNPLHIRELFLNGSSSGEGQANGTAGMSSLAAQGSFTLPKSNKPIDEVWKEITASVSAQ
ncbi:PREDICTED: delta(3,5)-Delta(2,4)-dienoyl-CoA isomerase, peroxisomal-like [Nelumbo nucifera]|uniref:Delta(3,5)-Delta(2,4)-dienoyl-CoA isomerase, peroxisomal-like n=1 Tax=Nelumbo nucifera TaxID=4432 RepID=A0A1U7Z9F7_NELNU|nr:PREDICTED: delta(3,5)-Delta(2,4)-dienoyl-CoA isomerase, peroxisomal-like [Nelumbo nucifera]